MPRPARGSHGPGVVVVVVIVVGLFDYDNDNDSLPGILVTTSVLIAPPPAFALALFCLPR
jgi:hypothetical protein